ncbi:MAG: hypothetical protein JWN99_1906 [Ilumatobacteraceae bacterium]|nr:hypothetical protein [Ilumatobacteraceae bacterium]
MDRFIESVGNSAGRFSAAVRRGPLDAPVEACPGWTLTDLAHHMGYIHRWARLAALTGAPPDETAIDGPPESGSQALADWIDAGAAALVDVLGQLDPAAPTWHPFPVPRVAAVWPRRQAHETQIHTWDAERAVGATSALDPAIAADGIAEYFEVIAPRVLRRDGRTAPIGSMTISCADTDARLVISSDDGSSIRVQRPAADDDLHSPMLWGPAESLLLALWGRSEPPSHRPGLDDIVADWLAFGGN